MSLSWKDAATTILTAGVVTLAFAAVQEWLSFLSVRWTVVGMLVLGIGACAVGAYSTNTAPAYYSLVTGVLVAVAGLCVLLGLIFGAKGYAVALASAIVVLWFIATVRHAIV